MIRETRLAVIVNENIALETISNGYIDNLPKTHTAFMSPWIMPMECKYDRAEVICIS